MIMTDGGDCGTHEANHQCGRVDKYSALLKKTRERVMGVFVVVVILGLSIVWSEVLGSDNLRAGLARLPGEFYFVVPLFPLFDVLMYDSYNK